MLPHLETVCTINTMEHQERLREVAKARVAASAQVSQGPAIANARSARQFAAWTSDFLTRLPGSIRTRLTTLLANSQAQPARHGT